MMPNMVGTVLDPLVALTFRVWAKIPSILGALVLLLVGSFFGRWARSIAQRVLKAAKIDHYCERAGINAILFRLGVGASPAGIIGFLVYWLIFLAFLLSAANVIQLTVVSEFLQQVVLFMPKLIAAILVLGGGLFLGHFVGGIVLSAAQANGLKGAEGLSKVAYFLLVVFSAIMALQRLGIDTSVLSRSVEIVVASVGFGLALAFGLSFGLAGKEPAAKWIQSLFDKKSS